MRGAIIFVNAFLLAACAQPAEPTPGAAGTPGGPIPASPTFDTAKALIDTDEGSLLIDVELAVNDQQRAVGLKHRSSLEPDAGMAFLFFKETSGGFSMKKMLIPLSVAFFARNGTILEILEMEPCRMDPCEAYDPGVPYFGALEVNRGAFERWGVEEGDRIHIPQ